MDQSKTKSGDQKVFIMIRLLLSTVNRWKIEFIFAISQVLRRLAQNREAARKSRLRKKVMFSLLVTSF